MVCQAIYCNAVNSVARKERSKVHTGILNLT